MPQYWGLVVAINKYSNSGLHGATGADIDGESVLQYLTKDLGMPRDNISYLQDENAKRSSIISEFRRHLIENTDIKKGDGIIFHYSGHGSRMKAPTGWTVVEEKTRDGQDNMIEVIVPFDDGVIDSKTGRRICSIPDRTLAALIEDASKAHGNNITIVLDCCHSGHGTRGNSTIIHDGMELTVRSVHPSLLSPLDPDVDRDLITRSLPTTNSNSTEPTLRVYTNSYHNFSASHVSTEAAVHEPHPRVKNPATNHILMAACGPREVALGGKKGGIFTQLWLFALRNSNIRPKTYAEIIKYINIEIAKAKLPQHPQCDGSVRDRLVFQETVMKAEHFDVARITGSTETLWVSAGEIHGIEVGARFEIHLLGDDLGLVGMLGSATVRRVEGITSLVDVLWDIPPVGRLTAVFSQGREKLRYTVVSNASPMTKLSTGSLEEREVGESIDRFRQNLRRDANGISLGIYEVLNEEESELRISFEGDGTVMLHRLDPLLGSIFNETPYLTAEEVRRCKIFGILKGIARFNKLLSLISATHPFDDSIVFEMYHLVTSRDENGEFVITESETCAKIIEREVLVEENGQYAIVLHNYSSKSLYVQIWYFDPNTYGIFPFYTSAEPDRPNLAANGGRFQIGASTEMPEPLRFHLPKGSKSDSAFIKIFLTDRPTKLDSLNQDELIGVGPDGKSNALRRRKRGGEGDVESTGRWDTILRKITVVKR
ncbi:hypothetical protein BDY19DRAFT_382482 [Irpex rosettiformis]|uniref:Uncharacterized protein n=1 Tax=Irpex rosettiformis TaxID=378272 RepID=A0ACB8TUY1_9APHY|nr:hypothetical protein BDY19DRAFT_382482 [Irpex rosettiformis]